MAVGLNKERKRQVEKIIYSKIRWQFKLSIALLIMAFVTSVTLECCVGSGVYGCIFRKNLDNYFDLVVTISTILTAAVVFFYSMIDTRRMGITNRTIISYYVGSYTIPIWFMFTLIVLPGIRFFLDKGWDHIAIAAMVCVFILQLVIIRYILISTSFRLNIRIICKVELRQMCLMLECAEKGEESPWIYMVHHMESVAGADSLFIDKSEIIRELLGIPFEIKDQQGACWEKVIYKYYYLNLLELFGRIRDEQELEKIYVILYEFARERTAYISAHISHRTCILINSAILNAALDSETAGKGGFCACFINEYVCDEMRNEQIVLFYLFHELMYREGRYAVNKQIMPALKLDGILEDEVKKVEKDCLAFWGIWADQYGISEKVSIAGYYNAMCTLKGESRSSCPILYIKNLRERK